MGALEGRVDYSRVVRKWPRKELTHDNRLGHIDSRFTLLNATEDSLAEQNHAIHGGREVDQRQFRNNLFFFADCCYVTISRTSPWRRLGASIGGILV